MNPIIAGAAIVGAIATIGGGALTLDKMHVSSEQFDQYLKSQETGYVLELKSDIREIQHILQDDPNEFLEDQLEELIDALCEIRPDDRLCD